MRPADGANLLAVRDFPHSQAAVLRAGDDDRPAGVYRERVHSGGARSEQKHHASSLAALGRNCAEQQVGRARLREDEGSLLPRDELELAPASAHRLEVAVISLRVQLEPLDAASITPTDAHRTEDASSLDGAGVVMVVRVRPRAVESLLGHDGDWLFGHHTASKAVQQGRIVDAGDIIELRR